jgi:hypothetical protein
LVVPSSTTSHGINFVSDVPMTLLSQRSWKKASSSVLASSWVSSNCSSPI